MKTIIRGYIAAGTMACVGVVNAYAAEYLTPAAPPAVATKISEFSDGSFVESLSFSPDAGRVAVVSGDRNVATDEVHVWSWRDKPHIVQSLKWPVGTPEIPGLPRSASLSTVTYSPDGKYLAFGHTTDAAAAAIVNDDVPEDAQQFATVAVRILDANTGAIVHDINDEMVDDDTFSTGFSSDGKLFVRAVYRRQGEGNALEVYRTDDWSSVNSYLQWPFTVRVLALSPTRPIAAVGGENWTHGVRPQLVLIDLAGHRILRTIDHLFPDPDQIKSLAWSADGMTLGAGTGLSREIFPGPNAVVLLDSRSGEPKVNEVAEEAGVTALCFSPDGHYLVEGEIGGQFEIWDASHKTLLQRIPAQIPSNTSCAFSKNPQFLALSSVDKVSIWRLKQ